VYITFLRPAGSEPLFLPFSLLSERASITVYASLGSCFPHSSALKLKDIGCGEILVYSLQTCIVSIITEVHLVYTCSLCL
jgi:hypothetical protein